MKIVLCHGVFDVLHIGHVKYFQSAKRWGDHLVVSITSDRFVNKGPNRPYFTQEIRKNMLEQLSIVDEVVISDSPTSVEIIKKIKPDFYVKGPDYKKKEDDVTGGIYEEEQAVIENGGQVVFTDDETFSSSNLINKMFNHNTNEQNTIIEKVKQAGGIEVIEEILDKISKFKVLVCGEYITDKYIFCQPEGVSNKSANISARYRYEEVYTGGTEAISKHISSFVNGVNSFFDKSFNCTKTRYLTHDTNQKMFEVTNIKDDIWSYRKPDRFIEWIKKQSESSDIVMFCDFGHGVFEQDVLTHIKMIDTFIALNVQTNSSNLGFNPFTKHSRFDYLTMDLKEARIATHDRYSDRLTLFENVRDMIKGHCKHLSMTLGSNGSFFSTTDNNFLSKSPAFADNIVDTMGAGDAFFAITSLLVKAECPEVMVPFLGNVFAGLKTKIIGNKNAVSKANFIKAVRSILK